MKKFSNLGLFKSKGRIFKESNNEYRTPFQRDKDRIVHSASFRRLKHKTQVFVNTEGDHYRTRITHSIEVSQIARSIAKYLKLNDDLTETLSLAHDLGHTPFGHAGEEALNHCMINHGGFDHNLQTLRIVMFLEKKYLKFRGLNLTIETLDGLLKHNGPIFNTSKINRIIGLNNLKKKINFIKSPSLEAQISSISDDIAYNNHDIQDGLKANLFKLKEIKNIDKNIEQISTKSVGEHGTGGMKTKIDAAKICQLSGCIMAIANGLPLRPIKKIIEKNNCTWFLPKISKLDARKKWIISSISPKGQLIIDDGAKEALTKGKSLLAAGIKKVLGKFNKGDHIKIIDKDYKEFARGLSSFSSDEVLKIMGHHSNKIQDLLGYISKSEVVHKDDMVEI